MKTWSMLVAVLMLGFTASLVLAEGAEHKQKKTGGEITKIDGANITVQPGKMGGEGKEKPAAVTFSTDDKTVVTKNGEKKAVSDLAVGDKAAVVLTDDGKTAVSITVKKQEAKKEGAHK